MLTLSRSQPFVSWISCTFLRFCSVYFLLTKIWCSDSTNALFSIALDKMSKRSYILQFKNE